MKALYLVGLAAVAALSTAGCSISGLGGFGPVASAPPIPAAPPPVVYGAFLDGPVGQKISPADKDKALAAEEQALATGQRQTWKGDRGIFGYVEPAPGPPPATVAAEGAAAAIAPDDACRAFTSTIYIGGRPQVGHGRGCAAPDGAYHVAG